MSKRRKPTPKPSMVYQQCPTCNSKNLIRLEVDALCGECDWDSTEEFVAMGGMDNIFAAYNDHFPLEAEPIEIETESFDEEILEAATA